MRANLKHKLQMKTFRAQRWGRSEAIALTIFIDAWPGERVKTEKCQQLPKLIASDKNVKSTTEVCKRSGSKWKEKAAHESQLADLHTRIYKLSFHHLCRPTKLTYCPHVQAKRSKQSTLSDSQPASQPGRISVPPHRVDRVFWTLPP